MGKIKTLVRRGLVLLVALCLLSGCGGEAYKAGQTASSADNSSSELNIALNSIPTTMDPQKVSDTTSAQYVSFFTGQLYRLDENNSPVPELAEGYEVSDDALTYTIHLKDGIRYSNGESIKARDFVYAFRRVADPLEASSGIFVIEDLCKVKNIEKVNQGELALDKLGVSSPDDRTFVVELEEPCPYFLFLLAMPVTSPCNEAFYRKCSGNYADSPEHLLSSGAFLVDKYEPLGVQVHYARNPYFINSDKVKLPGVSVRQVANAQQAEMVYQTGESDIIGVSRDYLILSLDDPDLVNRSGGVIVLLKGSYTNCEAWNNKNIRLAISKAIDRKEIADNYFKTGNPPLTRIVPEGFAREPNGKDFGENQALFDEECGFDSEKAKEYWEAGLKELSVSELTISLTSSNSNQELIEIIRTQLEKNLPGLHLDVKLVPPAQYLEESDNGDYELIMYGWGADYPDPNSFLGIFTSSASTNSGHYSNPKFDELIEASSRETDAQKRMDILHEAEEVVMDDLPSIPIYARGLSWLISERTKNVMISFDGNIVYCDKAEKE